MQIKTVPLPKRSAEDLLNSFVQRYSFYSLNGGKKIVVHKQDKSWAYIEKKTITTILRNICIEICCEVVPQAVINNVFEMIRAIGESCDDCVESASLGLNQKDNFLIYDCGYDHYVCLNLSKSLLRLCSREKSTTIFLDQIPQDKEIIPCIRQSEKKYLKYLKKIFPTLDDSSFLLIGVYIATLFIPNIHHPLLVISGEYGAAKTTFSRMIAKIVNPHTGDVAPMPKDLDDVATVINSQYFVSFDNLSYISREQADLLCLATTGGSYKKRKLYTDMTVVSMQLHNAIAINGLNLAFPYSDLMDRAILLELPRITSGNRLTEEEVWGIFYQLLPNIQGCIFKLLRNASKVYKNANLTELPRLADFAKWGYAIAESIDEGLGKEFLKQYNRNSDQALKSAAESNPLLLSIAGIMKNTDIWEGSATKLLKLLEIEFFKATISNRLPKGFPTTANVLSRKLNTLQNDLKVLGYELQIGRDTNRYIRISKIQED